jgi:ribonuclease-3
MNQALERLQLRLQYQFADPQRLQLALRHRSAGSTNNERLEFLGDGLVNLIAAEWLFESHPGASEGQLSHMRSQLVRQSALATLARHLDLGKVLELGQSASQSGGHDRDSILADAMEALIAACYLDGGWENCRTVTQNLLQQLDLEPVTNDLRDAKSLLQEWVQARGHALPQYRTLQVSGPGHERQYRVVCILEALQLTAEGSGGNRRSAEQVAAANLLEQLESHLE